MNFRERFGIIFGVIFVYLIMGVFFKYQIGTWFSAVWYIFGIAGIIFIGKYYIDKQKKSPKIINAEVVEYAKRR